MLDLCIGIAIGVIFSEKVRYYFNKVKNAFIELVRRPCEEDHKHK